MKQCNWITILGMTLYMLLVAALIVMPGRTMQYFTNDKAYANIQEFHALQDSLIEKSIREAVDSNTVQGYYKSVQDIYVKVKEMETHYQDDVNLMIYKTDAWMGYWMGIFAIVMTIPAILMAIQAYRTEKNHEKTINDALESAKKEIKSAKDELDSQRKDIEFEKQRLSRSFYENRMSTIMTTISSFPDPQMIATRDDKRQFLKAYLNLLYKEFNQYLCILEEQCKEGVVDMDMEHKYINLVLFNIKLASIRCQSTFSDLSQNLQFRELQDEINKKVYAFAHGQVTQANAVKSLRSVSRKFLILIARL